ncbi:hypothetical protein BGX30_007480, partial [Mortierella sp. GBA39]
MTSSYASAVFLLTSEVSKHLKLRKRPFYVAKVMSWIYLLALSVFTVLIDCTGLRRRLVAMPLYFLVFNLRPACWKIQSDFTDVHKGSECERVALEKRVQALEEANCQEL